MQNIITGFAVEYIALWKINFFRKGGKQILSIHKIRRLSCRVLWEARGAGAVAESD